MVESDAAVSPDWCWAEPSWKSAVIRSSGDMPRVRCSRAHSARCTCIPGPHRVISRAARQSRSTSVSPLCRATSSDSHSAGSLSSGRHAM